MRTITRPRDRNPSQTDYLTTDVDHVARVIACSVTSRVNPSRITGRRLLAVCLRSLDTVAASYNLPLACTPALTMALARIARRYPKTAHGA